MSLSCRSIRAGLHAVRFCYSMYLQSMVGNQEEKNKGVPTVGTPIYEQSDGITYFGCLPM